MVWVYCPCCNKHFEVDGALGLWIALCSTCNVEVHICWEHDWDCPKKYLWCEHRRQVRR
jgi:hypothetical protein